MSFAFRIYRRLARAFPHEFKLAYGAEMTQLGEEVVEDIAKRHGAIGLLPLLTDMAVRLPLEYIEEMRDDIRYGLRGLRKSRGFALVGIISMGLGIGLTTQVYTTKWQFITRDLPGVANAERLVMPEKPVSYYYVEQYREQHGPFAGVAAFETGVPFNVNLGNDGSAKPERVFGQLVSPNYFSVLGIQSQIGRVLSDDLEKSGDAPVVVISDRFWRNRLHSAPDAVGQTIRLNGQPATIVGITPKNFHGALPVNPSELFVPITVPATLAPELGNDVLHQHTAKDFLAIMCLAPGVTFESAEAELDTITRQLDEQEASPANPADKSRRVTLLPAGKMIPLPRNLKPVVVGFCLVLMGLVMIITCMNLANMLLARGANRRKELGIRLAVGASRFRLVRQMMSEGILLSLLGGIAGFAIAYILGVLQSRFIPPMVVPMESDVIPDGHALVFTFVIAVFCGIGFSLAPALRATKGDLVPALKEGSGLQLAGYGRFSLRNLLMVAQVAGSVTLLLITGFLVIGLNQLSSIVTKFDPHTMYLVSIDPVRDGYTPEKAQAFFEKLPDQLKTIGSVRSVTLAGQAPFSIIDEDSAIQFTAEDSKVRTPAFEQIVGAGYFAALSEPMLAGREFIDQDDRMQADGSREVPVILNESAARNLFGSKNAIGARVKDEKQSYVVVGMVHDLWNGTGIKQSVIYMPLTPSDFARPPAGGITIMVRSDAGTDALERIRHEIASLDPKLSLFNVQTLNGELELDRSAVRFSTNTYTGIGVFGLVLAAIGLAGVTAYAVAQRRKEIGIRMALGAGKRQVLRLVLREGAALVTVGTLLGFLAAYAAGKILAAVAQIFVDSLKIGTNDPRLLLGAPLLLAGLTLFACYVPARKAIKIDPLKALRQE